MKSDAAPSSADTGLGDFVRNFLDLHGAIVEPGPDGLHALLPEPLARHLELPEMMVFGLGTGTSGGGNGEPVQTVAYGTPLLDRMVSEASAEIPVVRCELKFDYLKTQGFENLVRERFRFPNSVGNIETRATVHTEYLLIHFRYQALSDERKDGLITLVCNGETGAVIPDMNPDLAGIEREFRPRSRSGGEIPERLRAVLNRMGDRVREKVMVEIETFRERMSRRLRRDVANLAAYYEGLRAEMEKSLERSGLSEQLVRERTDKIQMLPGEMARKREELVNKYGIRVSVQPCAVMILRTPAVRLGYRVSVGNARRTLGIFFNPLTRTLDPLVCDGCGRESLGGVFCRDTHLLCPACAVACPVCAAAGRPGRAAR